MTEKLPKESELILFSTPEGNLKIDVIYQEETVWLSQKRMGELFEVDIRTVNEHPKNIFDSSEFNYPEFPDSSKERTARSRKKDILAHFDP